MHDESTARRALRAALGSRIVAYSVRYAQLAGGSVTAGVFLAQLIYWADKGADPDGWIYKTQPDWTDETGLSRSEQEIARRKLRDAGVLEEWRRGVPARLYYRVDWDGLIAALAALPGSADKNAESRTLDAESRRLERENSQTYNTEMTTGEDAQESGLLLTREKAWLHVLGQLAGAMKADMFSTYCVPLRPRCWTPDRLELAAPAALLPMLARFRPLILKAVRATTQEAPTITFVPRL